MPVRAYVENEGYDGVLEKVDGCVGMEGFGGRGQHEMNGLLVLK